MWCHVQDNVDCKDMLSASIHIVGLEYYQGTWYFGYELAFYFSLVVWGRAQLRWTKTLELNSQVNVARLDIRLNAWWIRANLDISSWARHDIECEKEFVKLCKVFGLNMMSSIVLNTWRFFSRLKSLEFSSTGAKCVNSHMYWQEFNITLVCYFRGMLDDWHMTMRRWWVFVPPSFSKKLHFGLKFS